MVSASDCVLTYTIILSTYVQPFTNKKTPLLHVIRCKVFSNQYNNWGD